MRRCRSVSNTDRLETCRSPFSQKKNSVHKSVSAPMLSGMLDRKLKAYVADKRKLFRNGMRTYDKLQTEWCSLSESMDFNIHDVQVIDVEAQVSLLYVGYLLRDSICFLSHYIWHCPGFAFKCRTSANLSDPILSFFQKKTFENKLEEGQVLVDFEHIPKKATKGECSVATAPENKDRNRFKDVYPYDHNRVKLTPRKDNKHGYINASHMKVSRIDQIHRYIV